MRRSSRETADATRKVNRRVVISREDAPDPAGVLHRLARIIPLTPDDFAAAVKRAGTRSRRPIRVADRLPRDDLSRDLPMSAISEGVMPDKARKADWHEADWRIGDTVDAAIGQGCVPTSPLQLAVMTARIASGRAALPRLIHAIGEDEMPIAPAAPLPVDAASLDAVRKGRFEAVNGSRGTAGAGGIAEATMLFAGKTGTSQVRDITAAERARGVIANDDLPWNRRDHAPFVGHAPHGKPGYAVAAVVEHGGGGSLAAAPVARDAILRAPYDGIPPLTASPAAQRNRIGAQHRQMPRHPPAGGLPAAEPT